MVLYLILTHGNKTHLVKLFFFEQKQNTKKGLRSDSPLEGNGARHGSLGLAKEGHFTQIMGLKDSSTARFMYRQGSFDAVTLASP